MAIFDEQVLEPFIAKGIGGSGIASRQIQASNLPDLSAAVRQSAATQQNLADQQKATLAALAVKNYKAPSIRGAVREDDMNKPFVVGKYGTGTTYGGVTIAIPDGRGGFELRSENSAAPDAETRLKAFGVDISKDYPELNITGLNGKYTKEKLLSTLMQYSKQDVNGTNISLSNIIKKLGQV